ncbi:MAG TPA: phenylalanine--tRNA ligase subunit alpha [Candidatus Babeliales bacterium]|nr:phenylalanine--tRNA ligase subunit alpha [Candidatus Babeliales bacterium]
MNSLQEQIRTLKTQFDHDLNAATSAQELEAVRVAFLGRSGHMTHCMTQLKTLSLEEKQAIGPLINELKSMMAEQCDQKKAALILALAEQANLKKKQFDVTAYLPQPYRGTKHIYSTFIEQIETIFISMGYTIADGPELETDYNNFEALNIPADHPARDMHDTFWISDVPNMLLRTHTSPIQIRSMKAQQPPLAVAAPGRVYRNESVDASHGFLFAQIECMFVDKNVSMAHLLATAKTFLQQLFEKKDLEIRVRPGYFPFVEPGVEIDATCPFCTTGCSTCKKTRWIELLGAGLIHPNVLKACSIDPNIYSGFAFGMGLERLAMLKYGINDIRLFHSSSIHFLNQF